MYALKFGLVDFNKSLYEQEVFESKENENLSSFKGYHVRSLTDDDMNTKFYPQYKLILNLVSTYVILIMILFVYCGTLAGIFVLSLEIEKSHIINSVPYNLNLAVCLPALLNVVMI